MTQSIQNFDNLNNNSRQAYAQQRRVLPAPAVTIPDYYQPDEKNGFVESFKKSPIYTMVVKGFFGPFIEHPIASIFTWFGCSFLLDKYTEACGGEYEKSLLNKVVKFGDRIQNSKFIQSKPVQKILGLLKAGSQKCGKLLEKSSVIKAMKDTPTMPELEIVKQEMIPQRQRVIEEFNHITGILKLGDEGFAELKDLALSSNDKKELKQFFNKSISEVPKEQASTYIQLKRINKSDDFIKNVIKMPDGGVSATKEAILKEMGRDAEWINKVKQNAAGNIISEVQEATGKVGGKVKVGLAKYSPYGLNLGILTKPGERILSMDLVHNKLRSLEVTPKSTGTGRFLAKFIQLVHRGLTFGGGKYGVLLFIAPAFVTTAINVHKAELKEKVGTCVNNLTEHISWVFTFPIALQMMHHLCGSKYAGMKKDDVQKIRDLVKAFNDKNKLNGTLKSDGTPAGFRDLAHYNEAREKVNKAIKGLKTVKGQKWYTKFVRKLAGIITPDLGRLDAYNPGNIVGKKFSQIRNLPRNLWGVPARLILFGVLTMGVLDAGINKVIKLIFGGSYNSMKEEEQKDAKQEQKEFLKEDLNERLYEAQKQKVLASAGQRGKNIEAKTRGVQNSPSHKGAQKQPNSLNQQKIPFMVKKTDNYTYIPSQENIIETGLGKGKNDTYTYIPSQNSTIKSETNTNSNSIRTYVPSQAAANITKTWDNSGLQSALARAQRAEDRALKVLAGNFEGM